MADRDALIRYAIARFRLGLVLVASAADGGIGGYRWGPARKRALLASEAA